MRRRLSAAPATRWDGTSAPCRVAHARRPRRRRTVDERSGNGGNPADVARCSRKGSLSRPLAVPPQTHSHERGDPAILPSMLALTAVCVALRAPSGASPSSSRRAVLQGAASSLLFGASPAAFAFDTPDLTEFDDPKARALAAGKKNPSLTKQASASFYAITTGDLITLKKMLEAGWQLDEACDTSGKTPMHRAVTGCASNLRRPALLLCCAFHQRRHRWEAWARSSC